MVRKKNKKETNAKDARKNEKSEGKELYWIIGVMIFCILVLISFPWIAKKFNTFKYEGLTFTKERFDQLSVYHYYYNFADDSGQLYQYNLFLRNDPRKNNISVESEIVYPKSGKTIYLTFNASEVLQCPNALRDVASISSFFSNNMYNVKSGINDKESAQENNVSYITCDSHDDEMILLIEMRESGIKKQGNCYILSAANCEDLLSAVEKFEVQSIIDAKKRAQID